MIATRSTTARDVFGNLRWTCPHCGRELVRKEVELFGSVRTVPCYGSCGCAESRLDGLDIKPADAAYFRAGIPRRHIPAQADLMGCDLDASEGRSVYVHGPNGTLKTTFACALLKSAIDMGHSGLYADAPAFVRAMQDGYSGGSASEEAARLRERAFGVDVLLLDDLGKENPTPDAVAWVGMLVETRCAAMRPVVVTTNFAKSALCARYASVDPSAAEAIASRLAGARTVYMGGEDRRLGDG